MISPHVDWRETHQSSLHPWCINFLAFVPDFQKCFSFGFVRCDLHCGCSGDLDALAGDCCDNTRYSRACCVHPWCAFAHAEQIGTNFCKLVGPCVFLHEGTQWTECNLSYFTAPLLCSESVPTRDRETATSGGQAQGCKHDPGKLLLTRLICEACVSPSHRVDRSRINE